MHIHIPKYLFIIASLTASSPIYCWLPPLTVYEEELITPLPLHTDIAFNNAPSGFGTKHFIVGHNHEAASKQATSPSRKKEVFKLTADGRVCSVLFAPDQKICKKLIALIDHEKEKICIAAYMITDKRIAEALGRAQKRSVRVEVVVDPGCLQDRSNKIALLHEAHVPIYVYTPSSKGIIRSLMHDKFVLFANTIYQRAVIWTGSANFTCKADEINQENIVVLDDKELYKQYLNQFNLLKKRSERYEESLVTNAELHERVQKKAHDI